VLDPLGTSELPFAMPIVPHSAEGKDKAIKAPLQTLLIGKTRQSKHHLKLY
jgi:hypothetical protein